MISTFSRLLIFCTICLAVTLAATVQNIPTYDMYGNYKPGEAHKYNPDCCLVPTCDANRCIDRVKCDHICSTGNYPKASPGNTPGYRLKQHYTKYDCRFNECNLFKFTCYHCPDPRESDFSIYIVRKDCFDCYELY